MALFAQAIRERSFKNFYEHISLAWQGEVMQKQLLNAFQGFIDQDVNLTGVIGIKPVFDSPPQMTSEGILLLDGYYPTHPLEVVFSFKFIYELPNWKLFGMTIDLRKSQPHPEAEAKPVAAPAEPAPAKTSEEKR
jgi:hypothetical protein